MPSKRIPIEERFWAKVQKGGPDECWLWAASCYYTGYGRLGGRVPGRNISAHRLSWELHRGAIPEGLCVLHRCDCPPCVNPKHLFLGTKLDNRRDCIEKGRARAAAGEASPHAKLTDKAVVEIRESREADAALALRFGVAVPVLRAARQGKTWRHIAAACPPRGWQRGESRWNARLDEAAVLLIRSSDEKGRVLARRFGVSPSVISCVRHRQTWKHI